MELEGTSIAHDQHYTVSELAKRWHLSPNTVRRLVVDEPPPCLTQSRSRELAFESKPAQARLTPGTRPSISLFYKRV